MNNFPYLSLPIKITSSNYIGNHVAIRSNTQIFISNLNQIFCVIIEPIETFLEISNKNELKLKNFEEIDKNEFKHSIEIQEIFLYQEQKTQKEYLASIDKSNRLIIRLLNSEGEPIEYKIFHNKLPIGTSFGWGGIDMKLFEENILIATANMFGKVIDIYDFETSKLIRRIQTGQFPMQIKLMFLENKKKQVITTELNQIVVYDFELPEQQECVKRIISPSNELLYSLEVGEHFIAAGGANRSIYFYNNQNYTFLESWLNATKHEISHFKIPKNHQDICFVGGNDQELIIGLWSKKKRNEMMRMNEYKELNLLSDSNWIGFDVKENNINDENNLNNFIFFVGLSQIGSLYFFPYNIQFDNSSDKSNQHFPLQNNLGTKRSLNENQNQNQN
ncbi:hypothetical protein M0811_05320 [Anaeramoeba ignava]|uniref:WD40-repeat-containing domain n=1 Tax=Anaeramoeba ignava TaxID=1746090 RepID=A0A9Q0LS75_ANAIG|nr:hypothetical protein M0811_05320 [Anaeramoeba ignava]